MLPIATCQVNEALLTLDTSNYYEAILGVRTSLIWALFPVRVWLEARRMMVSIFTLMWLCPHNLKLMKIVP